MSFDALEAITLAAHFATVGVDATVTGLDGARVQTRAIWLEPILIDVPTGNDLQRREVRRVVALMKSDVPVAPRGLRIDGAEREGGAAHGWLVDEIELSDPVHTRVIVTQLPEDS